MNVRANFFAGVGAGIILATGALGLVQLFETRASYQQIAVYQARLHSAGAENARLEQQLLRLEQQRKIQPTLHKQHVTDNSANSTYHAGSAGASAAVVIVPGMTITQIADVLKNAGIIPSTRSFIIAAIKYNQTLRAGKFTFYTNEPYAKILYIMATN